MARLLRCTEAARGNAKIEIVFPLYFQLFSSMRFYGFITDSYMELAPSRIYISQCTSVRREWSFSNERIGGEWGCSWIFFAAPAAAKERGKGSGGERERDAVATSPQKSLHSCSRSLPRDDAAQKEKLIRFAKSCYFKIVFQSKLHYNSSPNEPQCELMNSMNHEYIKGNSVCVEREVNLS